MRERKEPRRQYPFRRKVEETPYEAIERLDKKLAKAESELNYWRFEAGLFDSLIADSVRKEIQLLKNERAKLVAEIEDRHEELLSAFPNANVVSM